MEANQVLELYPEYSVSVTLFDNVSNMSELKEMLVKGKLEAALVNATMVPNVFAVLLAANKAVHLSESGKIKTRNVFSEILYNLSPSNNISDSLKTFGLNEKEPVLVVVVINKGEANKMNSVIPLIKGEQMSLTKLQSIADENKIKKVYKIPETELSCGSLTDAVVTRIATKDAN